MQRVGLCFRQRYGVKIFSSNDILQFQFCYLPTHSSVIVQSVNVQSCNVQSVNVQSYNVQSCNVQSVNVQSAIDQSINIQSSIVQSCPPLRSRPSMSTPEGKIGNRKVKEEQGREGKGYGRVLRRTFPRPGLFQCSIWSDNMPKYESASPYS